MEPVQEPPQAKRARLSDVSLQEQGATNNGSHVATAAVVPSSTTGATVVLPLAAPDSSHQAAKPPANAGPSSGGALGAGPQTKLAAHNKFIADAREAVQFRAVSAPTAEGIAAEVASGGQRVSVDFLHQHFGDAEQIRGYSDLKITIWIHVRTYHVWVDMQFAAKRPGADKLTAIFEGAFPSGFCRSKDGFVAAVAATAAALPDLMDLGDCVGSVQLPATAYGIKGPDTSAQVEVSVRRFQISTAPTEIKALHARMEPLLLFTIDGAQFIDADDPQWELLLPVVRAADGGCLVLGLTTLFNFFAYPGSCRMRVSQVLVLSPWQGLGLGKALLKLSYDLARSRGCSDLTVEDPTPNLQRVREKLEVELLRGLGWVAGQARKCLDAVERGETAWPAWEGDIDNTGPPAPQQQPQHREAPDVDMAVGAEPGQAQVPHPLLKSHAFFRALGAVPPPALALPDTVHEEAVKAAEARWRERLAVAESAVAAAVADQEAAPVEAGAGASAAAASTAVTAAAGAGPTTTGAPSVPAASGAGPSGGPAITAIAALLPSAAFVSAITRELKMHSGQIRVVWEALLWSEPGALRRRGVKAALLRLVSARLEALHFSSVGRAAAEKVLVDIKVEPKEVGKPFFMYRPVRRAPAESGAAAEAFATGRLSLTQVTADDKARRMGELVQERRLQLESLAAALNRPRQGR